MCLMYVEVRCCFYLWIHNFSSHVRSGVSSSNVYVKRIQLVDPASVYMLVSKTKPCMPKYSSILVSGETADGSLNQLWSKWAIVSFWITVENPELIHAATSPQPNPLWELTGDAFIRPRRAHR